MNITLTMRGEAPLVMHNARMVDPLDDHAQRLKALTSKAKKSLDDHALISREEWEGGIYHDESLGPFIPTENVLKCLVEGARLFKLGKEIERAVVPLDEVVPLVYDGPRDLDGLWRSGAVYRKAGGVGKARVMRTRPKFDSWAAHLGLLVDESRLDLVEFRRIADAAGQFIGLGERRPLFGRFTAIVEETK